MPAACNNVGLMRYRRAWLRTALLLAAASVPMARGQSQPAFEAGAARRLITPDPLLPISGGMGIPTPAKTRQGELTVRALVLRAGSETIAIAGVDLLGVPAVFGDRSPKLS